MHDLNIDVICANSPAAKGRVERAHQTLQDRLVKELRLAAISDRDQGNTFLDDFRERYNSKFARSERDAHRPLAGDEDLSRIFSLQETRRLTDNLTLHYKRVMYIIEPSDVAERARGKRVSVREENAGLVHIEFDGHPLEARAFPKDARVRQGAIVENKILGDTLRLIQETQLQRDKNRLEHGRMTLREEDALRRAMGQPGLPTRRKDADRGCQRPSAVSEKPGRKGLLDDALAWAKQQSTTLPERGRRQSKRAAPKITEHSTLDERFVRLRDLLA